MSQLRTNQGQQPKPDYSAYIALARQKFRPLTKLIYSHKFDAARDTLEKIQVFINTSDLPEDHREALGYDLMLYTYHLDWHPDVNGWTKECYLKSMDRFGTAAKTVLGDYVRRRWIIKIKLHADLDGFESLKRETIMDMLTEIPLELSHNIWFDLSSWAWEHDDLKLIEAAFERFLIHPTGYLDQARWQRVNIMYQLMTGKATVRDVTETIKTLELKPQLKGFLHRLWPSIQKAGLVTPEIEQLLEEQISAVNAENKIPSEERKTKSFIQGNR